MEAFPMPGDTIEGQGVVIASTWYREDLDLAAIVVLRPKPPFYRVGVWNFGEAQQWDAGHFEDHTNIVPAVNGEMVHENGKFTGERRLGYQDMGGDY